MKKILIAFFVLSICLCLCLCCYAKAEENAEVDIKVYIQDKIVPIVVGVATSVVALITTLYKIATSLKALGNTKDTLEQDSQKREEATKILGEQVEQIKASIKDVPSLEKSIEELSALCSTIAEILSLGFSANEEIIKSGKGKRMSMLLENAKCIMQNAKSTPHPSPLATPSPQGEGKGE